ncbi:MAG: hypothetical protein CMQ16_06585 [Gammaproteobacteria bacterium]|nr:hypothetical protein [Gammaproteobacteria bacterium]
MSWLDQLVLHISILLRISWGAKRYLSNAEIGNQRLAAGQADLSRRLAPLTIVELLWLFQVVVFNLKINI